MKSISKVILVLTFILPELFLSAQNPALFKDIYKGSTASNPGSFIVYNGALYFSATDGTSGSEFWKSDGTPGGTVLALDMNPGSNGIGPRYTTNIGGILYFGAYTSTTGWEFWRSDGTVPGTYLIMDILPGSSGSDLTQFIGFNNSVFFGADDSYHGKELWSLANVPTSAEKNTADPSSITLYPNPSTGLLKIISAEGLSDKSTLDVFDSNGRLVLRNQVYDAANPEVDPSGLGKGIYIVKITTGAKVYTQKVILK
jgi:ELWxxDGT repeat protein